MVIWSIVFVTIGLLGIFVISFHLSKDVYADTICTIWSFVLSAMFFVLAKSPKNNKCLFGKAKGMKKKHFVLLCVFLPVLIGGAVRGLMSIQKIPTAEAPDKDVSVMEETENGENDLDYSNSKSPDFLENEDKNSKNDNAGVTEITQDEVNQPISWYEIYGRILDAAAEKVSFSNEIENIYRIFDFDNNGIPELFVLHGNSQANYAYSVYTYDTEYQTAISLGEISSSHGDISFSLSNPGSVYHTETNMFQISVNEYKLNGNAFAVYEIFCDEYTYDEDFNIVDMNGNMFHIIEDEFITDTYLYNDKTGLDIAKAKLG